MADTSYNQWAYGNYGYSQDFGGGASVNAAYGSRSGNNNKLNTHRYTRNDIRVAENDLKPLTPYTNSKVMLSTNIFIYSNQSIVGMLQSFAISEQRQINKLQAIGWEGVVQAVPNNTRGGSLSVNRIALYNSTLYNALGLNTYANAHNKLGSKVHTPSNMSEGDKWDKYTFEQDAKGPQVSSGLVFRTLKDQRAPLEIMVKTRLNGSENDSRPEFYTVTYIDCWLSQYSKPYSVQTIMS